MFLLLRASELFYVDPFWGLLQENLSIKEEGIQGSYAEWKKHLTLRTNMQKTYFWKLMQALFYKHCPVLVANIFFLLLFILM